MDELFDCDVEELQCERPSHDGAAVSASSSAEHSATTTEPAQSEDTDTTWGAGADGTYEDTSVAHSVPISIPHQMLGKGGVKQTDMEGGSFIPPHQLSLNASHIGQSVPLSSSSRLRTRNKLLRSTGFLAPACPHTEGFMVANRLDSAPVLTRTLSDVRLQSLSAETELVETHSEPLLQISNAKNSSNMQFLRDASKVSIPASIAEMLS